MLQLDNLISGNSATSAWTPSRRGRNSALRTSFATIFAFALVSRLLAKAAQSDERGTLPALAPDPHGNNDVLLPGFGVVAPNAASLIRRKA